MTPPPAGARITRSLSLVATLELYSEPEPNSGCILWIGSTAGGGYGRVWDGQRLRPAHAVAWELANGIPVPPGCEVCHGCDVPPCINDRHLFVGTRSDNMLDAVRKGRIYQPNPRLSDELRADIAAMLSLGAKQGAIAMATGVSQSLVSYINTGRRSDAELMTRARLDGHKTHCVNGHRLVPENLTPRADGVRECRTCHRERNAARCIRRKAERRALREAAR